MAIAHDSASSGTGVASTTCSWSHTLGGGSSLVLVVGIATDNGSQGLDVSDTSSVTYGGQSLTKVSSSTKSCNNTANNGYTELWYLIAPSGNQTVTVTFANSCNSVCGAEVFSGAHQTSPLHTVAVQYSNGTSASINVTSATDEISIAVCCDNKATSGSPGLTSTAGTQRWNADASAGSMAGCGQTIASSATAAHTWTINNSGAPWSASGISIKPAASGSELDISQGAFANFVASGRSFAASSFTQSAIASFTASGRSTNTGAFSQPSVATFAGYGSSTVAGVITQVTVGTFTASGSGIAAGAIAQAAAASLTGVGTATGSGALSQSALAAFTASGGSAAQAGAASQTAAATLTVAGGSVNAAPLTQSLIAAFVASGSGIGASGFAQSAVANLVASGSTAVQIVSSVASMTGISLARFAATKQSPSATTWGTRSESARRIREEEQQRDETEIMSFIRTFYDSTYFT